MRAQCRIGAEAFDQLFDEERRAQRHAQYAVAANWAVRFAFIGEGVRVEAFAAAVHHVIVEVAGRVGGDLEGLERTYGWGGAQQAKGWGDEDSSVGRGEMSDAHPKSRRSWRPRRG